MLDEHEIIRARTYALFGGLVPFSEWCGFRYLRNSQAETAIALPFAPHIADRQGNVAPGIIASLADELAGQSAIAAGNWRAQYATVSLQLSMGASPKPGQGLIGKAVCLAADSGHTISEIRIHGEGDASVLVCAATVRMIVVRQMPRPDGNQSFPHRRPPAPAPFLADCPLAFTNNDSAVADLPAQDHYLGNITRQTLHGGFVSAAMLAVLARLGQKAEPPLELADAMISFLKPGRLANSKIEAGIVAAHRRVGHASVSMWQSDSSGEAFENARLTASLRRV